MDRVTGDVADFNRFYEKILVDLLHEFNTCRGHLAQHD